ncbi:MAG: hypothetical protein GWN08_22120, partial [Gemmatimonadetes bacterium]|nr:hypothetical protein [Gemmatimonadota bacterium]
EGMQQALDILTDEEEARGAKSGRDEILALIGLNGAIQNELLLAIARGLHCLVDGEVEGTEVPN